MDTLKMKSLVVKYFSFEILKNSTIHRCRLTRDSFHPLRINVFHRAISRDCAIFILAAASFIGFPRRRKYYM